MNKELVVLLSAIWNPTFSEGAAGEGEATGGEGAAGTAAATATGGEGEGEGAGGGEPKTFTQEEVNTFLAKEKRKQSAEVIKTTQELQATQKKLNLTVAEREELDTQMETLRKQTMTKEELQREAQEKSKKAHQTQVEELTNGMEAWKNKYTESTILRSITDAAVTNEAVSPRQVVALLRPDTRLIEAIDEAGKPTGDFEARVELRIRNEEGDPVVLDLSPQDAVAKMKENDEFLNLFRGTGTGGVGGTQQGISADGTQADAARLARENPAEYRKQRKEGKISL